MDIAIFASLLLPFSILLTSCQGVGGDILLAPTIYVPTSQVQTIPDPCVSAPCLNDGRCIVSAYKIQSYTCLCRSGYTGPTCSKGMDECAGNPCLNGACIDNIGSFQCHCYPGFTGKLCETDIDECQSSPCQNDAICHQSIPGVYSCDCPKGFRGTQCEVDIDECMAMSPCQNGGVCRQGIPGNYTCSCVPGFTGKDCQHKIPECSSNPCQNGGQCVEGVGFQRFHCSCGKGFTGDLCEDTVKVCAIHPHVCGQGRCIPVGNGGHRCQCSELGQTRESCRADDGATFDPCRSSPCQNGGRCRRREKQAVYRCVCRPGFWGRFCQKSEQCLNSDPVCYNGGSCFRTRNRQPKCACPIDYTGAKCEIPVNQCTNSSKPCLNNGTCQVNQTDNSIHCHCLDGYSGDICHVQDGNTSSPHIPDPIFNNSGFDTTSLFVILGIVGTLAILVGVLALFLYFCKKERPDDFCMSPRKPRYNWTKRASSVYSSWIVNDDVAMQRQLASQSSITPPISSYYLNTASCKY